MLFQIDSYNIYITSSKKIIFCSFKAQMIKFEHKKEFNLLWVKLACESTCSAFSFVKKLLSVDFEIFTTVLKL